MLNAVVRGRDLLRVFPLWGMIAVVTAILSLTGFAARGFHDNGLRLGSQLAWRFTVLVYFVAIIARPLLRLIPGGWFQRFGWMQRQLLWGFCASFGVFLASVLVPNTLMPVLPDREGGLTTGMVVFVAFGAVLTLVIAYAASPQRNLGEKSRKTILGVGLSYFWLAYTLSSLSHLSGPHRPDGFYGASVMLMVVALLLRFADQFLARMHVRDGVPQI